MTPINNTLLFKIKQQMAQGSEHLSGPMAILCIVNGMIGGLILILPVMALEAGWLLTLLVILITGFISYYSCYLCIYHTGKEPDLDKAILKHFWGKRWVKVFYEVCILSTLLLILFLYYELIVLQWIGLAPPYEYSPVNPMINFIALFVLALVIKFKEFGATLMAYGIISIAAYLLFVTWVVGSEEERRSDGHTLQLFGGNGMDLAAALAQAFAVQFFFIPVLKKNRKTSKHKFYLLMAFVLGALAYAYIAFMGSYGILHRDYFEKDGRTQKTIQGYFQTGTWEVNAIEIIYLIHLYSVYPEYLLIGKKRFFSIFGIQQSEVGRINKKQLIFMLCVLGLCLLTALLRISLREIIEFNGAVLGFFFIYFFPVAIHFKCCFMKPDQLLEENKKGKQQQMEEKEGGNYVEMIQEKQRDKQRKKTVESQDKLENECAGSEDKDMNKQKNTMPTFENQDVKDANQTSGRCQGQDRVVSKTRKIGQLCVMIFMLVLGLVIMIQGLVEIGQGDV